MVKVNDGNFLIQYERSRVSEAKRLAIAVHIAEEGVPVGHEYRKITGEHSIADHRGSLAPFAYTRLVANDYRLASGFNIVHCECDTVDLLGCQCDR